MPSGQPHPSHQSPWSRRAAVPMAVTPDGRTHALAPDPWRMAVTPADGPDPWRMAVTHADARDPWRMPVTPADGRDQV
jgi:hypothetical protein